MKKALIITYYWPPSGGAGVQRWLKFAKYMREFGWEPVIYTPENPESPAIDHSLEKDIPEGITVLKTKIFEPYTAYKRFVGRKKNDSIKAGFLSEKNNSSLAEKIAVWIRGNFFIPDARKFWIKPSIRFLTEYLKNNHIDVIISTGPPHSMHLIALGLKKATALPWLADFRDPWTNIDFYQDLMLTKLANRKHHQLEKKVLTKADHILVISEGMKALFKNIHNRHYDIITNGYDDEDFIAKPSKTNSKFILAHIGSLVKTRNPVNLWSVLQKMTLDNPQFANSLNLKFIGSIDWTVKQSLIDFDLLKYTEITDYLPHQEVIQEQAVSEVLLLLINQTPNAEMILTGKFFEYLAARRPILCIGPKNGDAATIIQKTNSGLVADFNSTEELKKHIDMLYSDFRSHRNSFQHLSVEDYSRRNLTKQLTDILEKMLF